MRERYSPFPAVDRLHSFVHTVSEIFLTVSTLSWSLEGEGKPCAANGMDLTVIPPFVISCSVSFFLELICLVSIFFTLCM